MSLDLHVTSVLSLEEHDRSPVVRFILREAARCARGSLGNVVGRIHGNVERISTDNLMKMRGVLHAGVHKRIGPFNDELRASKSQHILSSSILREGSRDEKGGPMHLDKR
jgi:hypothetical protein